MQTDTQRVRHHRAIFDSEIALAIIATDHEGLVTDWSPGAETLLGWSASDMLGQPTDCIFVPEDLANLAPSNEMRRALAEGRASDPRWHLRRDGTRFWATGELTPLRDETGVHLGFVKILRDRTAAHRTIEALREAEARLRRAQEAGGVGLFTITLVDDILEPTPQFCRIFGLNPCERLPGDSIARLIIPEDRPLTSTPAQRRAGHAAPDVEYRIHRADTGEERWIARRAEFERDGQGRAVRLVGIVQDITDQRAARHAVEQSAAQFQAFAQAMPNHVWTAPPDGLLDWFNERVYEFSGAAPGELDGQGWAKIVHPNDLQPAARRWAASLASGQTYETEFRLRRADGAYRWHLSRAVPIRGAAGEITRWIGTNTDIEDQKIAVHAFANLNQRLERQVAERTADRDRMWRLSTDIMLVARLDSVLTAVNPAWTTVLGWSMQESVGHNLFDLIHPDDREPSAAGLRVLAEGGVLGRFENRLRHRDGAYRWIAWAAVPGDGFINAVGRDFTAEKQQSEALAQAQEALRQSQKMEAVGQLTGGLAHDFNNLLTGITGSLEMLQTRVAQGRIGELDRYIHAAQGAARRAASLTHRLLAFSRRQTLDSKPTDVNRLVAGMAELIQRTVGPQIEVEMVASAGLWATLVDHNQLENALLNMCINARDAMPDGGKLVVETANRWLDGRAAQERDLPAGQYISLCVSDNGTGMAPDIVARAFDPFFTTKPLGQGTGLGLSMIYGFARQSGGQARIYSELGCGAMVCLYLPRHADSLALDDSPPAPADMPRTGHGETVLVVDDEPTVRMLVVEVLNELGYHALEAADGSEGLKILQSTAPIDLLVTDVGLPGGMNGRQVADAGRALRPGLKILFITGYAENAVISHGHLPPGMHVLTKPFAMEALAARIKELTNGPAF